MALPWSFVSKITNSKHQITNKSQITNSKPDVFSYYPVKFLPRLPNLPNGIMFWLLFHRGETFSFVSSELNLFGFYLTGLKRI